LRVNRPSA